MKDLAEDVFDLEVTALGRCLRERWEELERSSALPLTRSLTLNHIGACLAEHETKLLNAIDRLLVRHPCRAFLVVIDESATEIRAQLRCYTREHRLNRSLRLELIHLRVSPADVPKISNLILPLLINDLPTQVYWSEGIRADLSLLAQLSSISDQLVYDSSLFEDPRAEISQLETYPLERVDLTWIRLAPWRRGLAEAFEYFDWQPDADTKIEIHHNHKSGSQASALLIRKWLAAKLNTEADLIVHDEGDLSELVPIKLRLQNAGSTVELHHDNRAKRIRTKVSTPDLCLVPYELTASDGTRGDLLAAAADLCWT